MSALAVIGFLMGFFLTAVLPAIFYVYLLIDWIDELMFDIKLAFRRKENRKG